jgi:hypothetical protein
MNKVLEISRFFYIIGIGLIPFVTFPYSFTPFTLSKTYFLIFITFIATVFYFLSKPKNYEIPLGLAALLILEFLLNINNFNLYLFPRYSEHFLITATIFIFVFLGKNLFQKIDLERIIFYSSFIVVIPSLADLILSSERTSGTIGQANFFGVYLSLVILILIKNYELYTAKLNKYYLLGYSILLIVLFIKSASIASLICISLGLFFIRENLFKINHKLVFIFLTIFISCIFLFGEVFVSKLKDTYNQLFNPTQTIISDSFLIRKEIWKKSFEVLENNPEIILFGAGPNNFSYFFEKNRGNALEGMSEENFLFDKPHNYFIEILINYGIIYFLIFIFLVVKGLEINKDYKYLIAPLLFFMFFNWLDIYFKVVFFLLCFSNLYKIKIDNFKYFELASISLTLTTLITFSILFYRDTSYFFGNKNYIYSYQYKDIVDFKVKDPIVLLFAIEKGKDSENQSIREFLLSNFPGNQAILFILNKLF